MIRRVRTFLRAILLALALTAGGTSEAGWASLWPLYSFEGDTYEFLAPLVKYRSPEEWRFFPFFSTRDTFCVFPEFWITKSSVGLLPVWCRKDLSKGTVFPLAWWELSDWETSHALLPFYASFREGDGHGTLLAAGGLYGSLVRGGRPTAWWLYPFYRRDVRAFAPEDRVALLEAESLPAGGFADFRLREDRSWFLVLADQRIVTGSFKATRGQASDSETSAAEGLPTVTEQVRQGLWFVFEREAVRTVTFDSRTRARTSDETRSRTSLLWGLYRRETDPQRGTSIDLFYLPVIRTNVGAP